jgi:predicted  nucleic acid-binding Zn-ribbon protein
MTYYGKKCGIQFADMRQMRGVETGPWHCVKCGIAFNDFKSIVYGGCSVGEAHILYEGTESGPWHCIKCGLPFSDFKALVYGGCSRGGKHEII